MVEILNIFIIYVISSNENGMCDSNQCICIYEYCFKCYRKLMLPSLCTNNHHLLRYMAWIVTVATNGRLAQTEIDIYNWMTLKHDYMKQYFHSSISCMLIFGSTNLLYIHFCGDNIYLYACMYLTLLTRMLIAILLCTISGQS